jgi:hypothetical protein
MKITEAMPVMNEYSIEYRGERIKKNEEGLAVLDRGRFESEEIAQKKVRKIVRLIYLVRDGQKSEWMKESEIVRKYGKKKFKRAEKAYLESLAQDLLAENEGSEP